MKQKIYQVDAFSSRVFEGNPAAVCPLEDWLPDTIMQKIAMENNLAETAFYVNKDNQFNIRWFTPNVEVDLCGHATLAAAYVIFEIENYSHEEIIFYSHRSGILKVSKKDALFTLNFPTDVYEPVEITHTLTSSFNLLPTAIYKGKTDYLFVYETEKQILEIKPDYRNIEQLDCRGVIVTAKGNEVDFVSRFFAPQCGVNEDPVTGSAHTTLTPYWNKQLGKMDMQAIQLSPRKGFLQCKYLNDRVEISGEATLYLQGEIFIG